MVEVTTPLTYVALLGEFPAAVSRDLDAVKAYAQGRERQHNYDDGSQREFRWDEVDDAGQAWRLMARNPRTNRWAKTSYIVRLAPILDPGA
ncbi:hypothetical protein ABH931_006105 [Streptacidiphilus sp. MAP12-33]|uniref:hypothetical protein n=1 Tax=Streptacidiphilus sp. MAP12-33 TaxID=3156266 RepID=UPI0035178F74